MTTATAKMTVTIEIDADGSWGDECRLSQVHVQAKESVLGKLRLIVSKHQGIRIVGTPVISEVKLN